MTIVPGIPGTISNDAKLIRWQRMPDPADILINRELKEALAPGTRQYRANTADGGYLRALLSHEPLGKNGRLLWHISVSHRDRFGTPDRVPTWDELKRAVYELVKADVCMVLLFPRRSAPYVNIMDTCLHLFEDESGLDE